MDGILSSFRFSKKQSNTETTINDRKTSPQKNDSTESSQKTLEVQVSQRSSNMRLTKNSPTKSDETLEQNLDPILPSTFGNTTSSLGQRPISTVQPNTIGAVIGPKITFKGEIVGEEDLLVQGKVEGSIDLKGNHLIVGTQGVLKANLKAKTITIEGTVEGDVYGQELIQIKASSNVKGNLVAARIILEDGAQFRGSVDMDSQTKGSTAKQANQNSPQEKTPN